jgi:outer membrane receptor protein involved in Fe transport
LYYQDRRKTRDFFETAPGFGVATGTGTDLIFDGGDTTDEKEGAVYEELTYHFAEQWEATLGARSFDAHVYLDRLTGGLFGGQELNNETRNSLTTPKFSMTYIPGNEMRFYALASEGYRLGGDNFTVPTASACATPSDVVAYQDLHSGATFKPDSLWNYELGSKIEMLDRRVRVNAAVFLIDWRDIQQNVNACGFNLTVNAGTAQIRGAEIEAEAALGFGTTVGLSGSRLDAKLTETVPGVAVNGARVLGVPDWQANAYMNWSVPAWGDWQTFVRPQLTYTGNEVFTFAPVAYDPSTEQGGTTQYDLRLGLRDSVWAFALYGTNLSDVRRSLGPNTSLAAELPGRPRLGVNATRTVGFHVMRSF